MADQPTKKYEFVESDTIRYEGRILKRIRAIRDFGDGDFIVREGELGGFIEKEKNLSHENDCWVFDDGKIFDNAKVYGHARVYRGALIHNYAFVFGYAKIYGQVYGYAQVYGRAFICNDAHVFDYARVHGYADVQKNTFVSGYAELYGYAETIGGNTRICGYMKGFGQALVSCNEHSYQYKKFVDEKDCEKIYIGSGAA